jgi:molybdate transport system ATP-binding protein
MNKPNLSFSGSKILHTADGPQRLDIAFELQQGRLLTIYGPSGAGKTTLLRMLAGLTDMDSGIIESGDEVWYDKERKINKPARHRSVGMVFQDFALFPHLTVRGNLEFALQKKEDKKLVEELIGLMELDALQNIHPSRLSGGQQQRVALARAMVRRPGLLLLDEPLSALDDEMRFRLQDYILRAHRQYGLTTILVSHYLPEIFRLSDEIICLEKGRIQRQGTPSDIFSAGKTSGKFRIIGEIVEIVPADIVFIVTVLAANNLVKVIATQEEAAGLQPGAKVIVASKAFNPVIIRIE